MNVKTYEIYQSKRLIDCVSTSSLDLKSIIDWLIEHKRIKNGKNIRVVEV